MFSSTENKPFCKIIAQAKRIFEFVSLVLIIVSNYFYILDIPKQLVKGLQEVHPEDIEEIQKHIEYIIYRRKGKI